MTTLYVPLIEMICKLQKYSSVKFIERLIIVIFNNIFYKFKIIPLTIITIMMMMMIIIRINNRNSNDSN